MKNRIAYRWFCGVAFVGAVLLMASCLDAQNLFLGDDNSGSIYEYAPDGTRTTFATGLANPVGLAFNSKGDLFVILQSGDTIYEYSPDGTQTVFASGLEYTGLVSIAFDSADNMYLGSEYSNCVYEVTPSGTLSLFALVAGGYPDALAINNAGDVFVADYYSILKITPGGVQSTFASGFPNNPSALVFDSTGDLFASDLGDANLYEYTPNGAQSIVASNLFLPAAMTFDSFGNLFVCTAGGQGASIVKITPGGQQSSFVTGPYSQVSMAFQPVPQLQAVATNGTFQVSVSEPAPYFAAILQTSTNLTDWVSVYTNTPPYTFTDSMATTSVRFYRALLGP